METTLVAGVGRCEDVPGLHPGDRQGSLRMLGQSLAREFHRKKIHVIHLIVDGQIDTPKLRARDPTRAAETIISPDSIAEIVLFTRKRRMFGPRNSTSAP